MSIDVIGVGTWNKEKRNMREETDTRTRTRGGNSLNFRGRHRDYYGGLVKGEAVDGNRRENKSTCLKDLQLLECDLFCLQTVPAVQGNHLQHRTHV